MKRWGFIAILLYSLVDLRAEQPGFGQRLAITVSHQARNAAQTVESTRKHLAALPEPSGQGTTSRIGFHSVVFTDAEAPLSLQLDLGGAYPIEAIALVPVGSDRESAVGAGYGFPRRFRIEGSSQADFSEPIVLADQTGQDLADPLNCPVLLKPGATTIARYVRLTVTRHFQNRANDWFTALGEWVVVSGGRNVAAGRSIELIEGEGQHYPPAWRIGNLTDGCSVMGPPVMKGESPSNGFLSANAATADEEKWIQLDLGKSVRADEILLIPARPTDVADNPGIGFPVRFQVLAGYAADFRDHHVLVDHTETDFPNPGENPVQIPGGAQYFRYLRLVATRLWERGETKVLALAEIEVLEGGPQGRNRNLADGAGVSASDRYEGPGNDRWAPEYVVDGYSSRHPLVPWNEHLHALDERRRVLLALPEWIRRRDAAVDRALMGTMMAGGSLLLLLVVSMIGLRWRNRRVTTRAMHQVRRQIASDLHDEVGSNLGSIALLAQMGAGKSDEAELCADKFQEISDTARETAESMRDIVWLLKAGSSNTEELRRQMVVAARMIGEGVELCLTEDDNPCSQDLPLEFTRNVYLIYKEALTNARKHADARRLEVDIGFASGRLQWWVKDDGQGFDPNGESRGNGLGNLRDRAGSIGAELAVESRPGKGTRIGLRVAIPKA